MKKLLMTLVVATVVGAVLRAVLGQTDRGRGATAPGAGNGSQRSRVPRQRAGIIHSIDEAIEMSALDVAGAPVGNGRRATGPDRAG